MKRPIITLSVNGYDCSGHRSSFRPEELELIAKVFTDAAEAVRNRQHGALDTKLVSIGIDFGGPFDEVKGLPTLREYKNV